MTKETNKGDILYREWVPAGMLIKALVGFFSLLILCCILLVTMFVGLEIRILIFVSPLVFIWFVFWNYRGIRITVTKKNLLVYYGFLNHKNIHIDDIMSCEPTKAQFRIYGGIGIRYETEGRAYTTSFGDAVRITLRKGNSFVFSSNNTEKICYVINQMKREPHLQ